MGLNEEKIMQLIEKMGNLTGTMETYITEHNKEHDKIDCEFRDQKEINERQSKVNDKVLKLQTGVVVIIGAINLALGIIVTVNTILN
jgi:C4-dicarboxylate-specific signal transduction histidine kinase